MQTVYKKDGNQVNIVEENDLDPIKRFINPDSYSTSDNVDEYRKTGIYRILNETSLYNSDVSAYFSNLEDATTVQDKVNILVNIAKEIAFFNSSNASAFIEALDIQ